MEMEEESICDMEMDKEEEMMEDMEEKEDIEEKEDKEKEHGHDSKPHMGIPEAKFVEDVDEFMARPENNGDADKVLKQFDEIYHKYRFMEYNLTTKRKRLKSQIPELQKSLDMTGTLQQLKKNGSTMKTLFLLSDPLLMNAVVPPTDKVLLCIGTNVILEYDLPEAAELLAKNLASAKKNLENVEEDLDYLRDQFTVTEVNMARVYNWNIKKRQNEDEVEECE